MNIFISLIICLAISFVFSWISKKLNISTVIGLIGAGLFIGLSQIKNFIVKDNIETILILGDIGLLSLIFIAGLETSWRMFYKERNEAMLLAFFSALIPFLLGFTVFNFLGFSPTISVIIGLAMAITAEATKARVLLEIKKLNTRIGSLMIEAGLIDDMIGVFLFVLISYFLFKDAAFRSLALLIGLVFSFFAGILMHKFIGRHHKRAAALEIFLLYFIVPFFFIGMGLHFNFKSLILNPYYLFLIIAVAIAGKILGSLIIKPFTKLRWKQLYLIGWGMNSRGAIELAIAFVFYEAGLLNANIYSSLVIMAIFTTLLFPLIIKRMVKLEPGIMD